MSKTVFISYRKDSGSSFARSLEQALTSRGYDVFLDVDTIDAGRWADQIRDEVRSRAHFLLLLTQNALERCASPDDWVRREYELARTTNRNIVPVHDERFDFQATRDVCPADMEDLFDFQMAEIRNRSFADDVERLVQRYIPPHKAPPPPEPESTNEDATRPQRIAPTRLPRGAPKLFGRKKQLQALDDAWKDPTTNVITLVAWGGVGKTSLVHKWVADLAAREHDGADYFDWSFYSQGTREEGSASADAFVDKALRFFGDEAMAESTRSPWDKGSRLAELVAERRTLLVLDGLEPLQHPPGPLAGELKDPAITALLKGLAARNAGLCVVTTRERVEDLVGFEESTAPRWELEHLSIPAGVELLESVGVHGAADELEALVDDVHGHALTLNLLGRFLAKAHGGDVRRRDLIDFSKADRKRHASKVMEAYETWLATGGDDGACQLAILRLLGLFDRPADPGCLAAPRREPAIPGLTEPLMDLDEDDWNVAVGDLAECGLLAPREGGSEDLDTHPLVREHFGSRLREDSPEAWKEAHSRLFDHLKDTTEHQPDSLDGLQPLYQAVVHGCHAERHQEACEEVYLDRINRGKEFYSTKKLGAFGVDLGAISCFFESPWSRVSPSLTEGLQVWLLNEAATRLRALGRLKKAVEPMRAGLRGAEQLEDWSNAARYASNLSELELTLGDVPAALRDAEKAVGFADQSNSLFLRLAFRTTLADAFHQAGRRDEALARFQEAETMQAERQPHCPLLNSHGGFRYCRRLLADAERAAAGGGEGDKVVKEFSEIERRAAKALQTARLNNWTLDIALDHLTLGRVRLYRAILEGSSFGDAKTEIEQAVDVLRAAGEVEFVARGLLTRAWLRSAQGDDEAAGADLAEAQEIAERGPMPLHLADVHLYRARLFHDRDALAEARRLVDEHGYGRREQDLQDLEAASSSWPSGGSHPLE